MHIWVDRLLVPIVVGLTLVFTSARTFGQERGDSKLARTDRYTDLLPQGAIARLGSVRFHHPGGIVAGAFSPDGKIILAAGAGKDGLSLRFLEIASGRQVSGFELAHNSLRSVAFSPDGKKVGVCCEASVELYDVATGKRVRAFLSEPTGGSAAIISFAFSPDGKMLAAGCVDGKGGPPVRVWEIESGRESPPFAGPSACVNAVTFSADGQTLFAGPPGTRNGGNEKMTIPAICVWDVATRKKIRQIGTAAWNHAFAPNGAIIAYESNGLKLVSVATGEPLAEIAGQHTFFAFAPDSKSLASLDVNKALTTWDVSTGKPIQRFEGLMGNMSRLIGFSPDGKRLALMDGGWNEGGSIRFWDVSTGYEIRLFNGHHDEVTHVAYSPDGTLLASASKDASVRLWVPATGKQLHILKGHQGLVFSVAFAPDGKTVASSSADGTTRLWNVGDGRHLVSFRNPPGRMAERFGLPHAGVALSFAPDGKTLFAVGADGMFAAWECQARKEVQRNILDRDCTVRPVFLPNMHAVLTASGGEWDFRERSPEALYLWTLAKVKLIQDMPLRKVREFQHSMACRAVAASADERMLASSQVGVSQSLRGPRYHDPTIVFWERMSGKELLQLKNSYSSALAFSPDGELLAADDGGVTFFHGEVGSRSAGRSISLHDTLTGDNRASLSGHTAQVRFIAFAPDGKTLATASADHTILVWNTPILKKTKADVVKPTAEQLELWWEELGNGDAAKAHQAAAKLVLSAAPAVALLRDKVRPATAANAKKIAALIVDLESARFPLREQATRQLEQMEDLTEPALQAALKASPSLELRRRLEFLLDKAAIHSPRQIQKMRALTVLERIASTEAQQVLESLANGTLDARLTREAESSLRRVRSFSKGS